MVKLGYALSSEEHDAGSLVRYAAQAEAAGFEFALISDHFHPWIDRQGHGPFVWAVLGGIAQRTTSLSVGTGVSCPMVRTHPAVVAQAAATVAAMMPERFFLGVGTGENLNEHITGDRWPPASVRLTMLQEAIEAIRKLWTGDAIDHHGEHYVIEGAKVYLDAAPPPLVMAASGAQAADIARHVADGLVTTSPDKSVTHAFESGGGRDKPRYGQVTVCWGSSEVKARRLAHEWWPNAAITGQLGQELPMPSHFEQAAAMVSEDDIAEVIVCGPDPDRHAHAIREYVDAGIDHVYVHQVGPDQDGFFGFYESEVLPAFR